MPQGIVEIKDMLAGLLNPSAFTLDSAEGVVVTVLAVVIVYRVTKNLGDFVGWLIGALFLIQLGYVLGFTVLNNYIPFSSIFKFDVITAMAQLFAGTPICDALLYVSAFINFLGKVVTEAFEAAYPPLSRILDAAFESMPWQGR